MTGIALPAIRRSHNSNSQAIKTNGSSTYTIDYESLHCHTEPEYGLDTLTGFQKILGKFTSHHQLLWRCCQKDLKLMRNIIDQFLNGTTNKTYKRLVKAMWFLTFAGIVGVFLLFLVLSFSDLPSVQQLENPRSEEATQIFGSTGEVIGRYYTENRVPVTYDQLDADLINALIATEDVRYFKHSGIDFKALGRVAVKTILLGDRSSGGASTITQQLAKLLFTGTPASGLDRVVQKFKEWIIAVRLERRYTKEEIIAMYLNKYDFLYQGYGIKAAAETYFNTTQDSLSIEQAAVLVGMLKNSSLYNPISYPDNMLKRRNVVLKQMQKNNILTQAEYDSLKMLPLGLEYTRKTHIDGIATYFRMEMAKEIKRILSQPEYRKSDGSEYNIYTDGLRIYTTIDPKLQAIAEEEMTKHMGQLQEEFDNHWSRIKRRTKKDPWTYVTKSETEAPLEIRQQTLDRLIRETERYQKLRESYLTEIIETLRRKFNDITFHSDDREIVRMMEERKNPGALTNLVSLGYLPAKDAANYRRVMASDYFPDLVERWNIFQGQVEKVFNTPVEKMRVFSYSNKKMEVDTTMTPLDSIKYHRMFLQTGIMAVEPVTGYVKVWIGGINHKYFQYDHVRTNRQVGSTFKPFIYATAIAQMGLSPCFKVYDLPQTIQPGDGRFWLDEEWTPRNFDGQYTGELLTLKEGLRKSKNTVSVYLMKQIGDTQPVRGLVHNMGIDSSARYPNGRHRVPMAPSICLGSTDLTVFEMTGAYSTFANNGIYNRPTFLMKIEDKNGRTIYEEIPETRAALQPNANYVMVEMLRYSANVGPGYKSDIGGKTGTTNDFADGWFMGITPNLVVGTWVGGEDRWIGFRFPALGQGSHMAKPFFRAFLKRLENEPDIDYDKTARFHRPPGDLGIELDCMEYDRHDFEFEEEEFQEDVFTEDMFGDEAPRKQGSQNNIN